MSTQEDIELIRKSLHPKAEGAFISLERLEKAIEELTNAARNAIGALIAEPEPTYEYATPYKEEWNRGIRDRYDTWTDEEYARFLVDVSPDIRILVRRAVSVGDWEEVS